jgi:hypothetical protein
MGVINSLRCWNLCQNYLSCVRVFCPLLTIAFFIAKNCARVRWQVLTYSQMLENGLNSLKFSECHFFVIKPCRLTLFLAISISMDNTFKCYI